MPYRAPGCLCVKEKIEAMEPEADKRDFFEGWLDV